MINYNGIRLNCVSDETEDPDSRNELSLLPNCTHFRFSISFSKDKNFMLQICDSSNDENPLIDRTFATFGSVCQSYFTEAFLTSLQCESCSSFLTTRKMFLTSISS